MTDFCYRIFKSGSDVLLALCDAALAGQVLKDGSIELDVSRAFYGTSTCSETQALAFARNATIINAVGTHAVRMLVDNGLVDEAYVLVIGGVPHAQAVAI